MTKETDQHGTEVVHDATKRATQKIEATGGLPDENDFTDVVQDLRNEGASWQDIFDEMNEVFDLVDSAAFEESFDYIQQWRVAYVETDPEATSGERYAYKKVFAESQEKAESQVNAATHCRVESSKTEHIGWGKAG